MDIRISQSNEYRNLGACALYRRHARIVNSRITSLILLFALGFFGSQLSAAENKPELKNWFDDPFFQVRDAIKSCPIPLGPVLTDAQRRDEAHYRVERGTSCWLEGKCDKPNAYLYDAPIAQAIAQRFSQSAEFNETSLWITVQRKFVIVQGCIHDAKQAAQIETLIKTVPDVDRVISQLISSTQEKPPYLLAPVQSNEINRSDAAIK